MITYHRIWDIQVSWSVFHRHYDSLVSFQLVHPQNIAYIHSIEYLLDIRKQIERNLSLDNHLVLSTSIYMKGFLWTLEMWSHMAGCCSMLERRLLWQNDRRRTKSQELEEEGQGMKGRAILTDTFLIWQLRKRTLNSIKKCCVTEWQRDGIVLDQWWYLMNFWWSNNAVVSW